MSSATTGGQGGEAPSIPPECVSSSGFQVCGGSNLCPYDESACPFCNDYSSEDPPPDPTYLAICENDVYTQHFADKDPIQYYCGYCADGDVCYGATKVAGLGCTPFEVALLFDANGGADRLRYADHSQWTGAPLPEPADCPNLPDVPLCGGQCGGCASPDDICTGRSPLHPYGLCIPALAKDYDYCGPKYPSSCEKAGYGCFTWKVQPDFQAESDGFGYCLPLATCKAAAETLPGGGFCLEPPP